MRAVLQNWDTRARLKSNQGSGFSNKIGTIPPNSGRLDLGFFFGGGGGSGSCFPGKN